MSRAFRRFSVASAALTANALRPLPTQALGVPSMFGGWLTAELAPQNLAITAAATATHVARHGRRSDWRSVALNAASMAGLVHLLQQGRHARDHVDAALRDALGPDYAQRLDREPDPADLATPWREVLTPWTMGRHPDVEVIQDIPYGDHGRRGLLDIRRPRNANGDSPVLLQLHGGAWVIGEKKEQAIPLMTHLASKGWICVVPNYRLSPRATWPEHLLDCKRALGWVRQHIKEYGGDPSFVAVTGGSAGGHLAAMVALTPNDLRYQPDFPDVDTTVQACVPHYGVYDIAATTGTRNAKDRRDRFWARMIMKRSYAEDPKAFEDASPICLARPDAPPFFVLHGAHDTLAPVVEARAFVERLRAVSKSTVAYAELPGTQHAFDIFPSIRSAHVLRGVERFLLSVLLEGRRNRSSAA